jgi:hypothetical protein
MAIASVMGLPGRLNFVAVLAATKSNGLPPPLPGCTLGGRVGFDGSSLDEVACPPFIICEVVVAVASLVDSIVELGTTTEVALGIGVVDAAALVTVSVETGSVVDIR